MSYIIVVQLLTAHTVSVKILVNKYDTANFGPIKSRADDNSFLKTVDIFVDLCKVFSH